MIQHNVLAGRGLWVFGALSSDSPNGLVPDIRCGHYQGPHWAGRFRYFDIVTGKAA